MNPLRLPFSPGSPRRRSRHLACRLLVLVLTARIASAASAAGTTAVFDVPAGEAIDTLRQMARQGGAEIVFLAEIVRGVRTPAVRGRFTLREALDRLVAPTPLIVTQDARTGGLSVTRAASPPAAPPPSSPPDPGHPSHTMKTNTSPTRRVTALLAGLLAGASAAEAQDTPATPSPAETVTLSPFVVNSQKDVGYLAASTLAGSRLNTSLFDTPASISVMTKEFLDDVGATNVADALVYSLNAERDTSESTGNGHGSSDLPVSIRGFGNSGLGRNYFQWGLESDTFNTERIDFSRGPNSILFGTGGPGGIINTTTKRAVFGREIRQVGLRAGAWHERRATLDYGRPVGKTFAVRVNAVLHRQESWRDFVAGDRQGAALALTYRPFKHTEIRFDGEYGEFDRVLSNVYLPGDSVTPWLGAGRPLSTTYSTIVTGTARTNSRVYVHDAYAGTVQSWFNSVITNSAGAALSAGIPRALTDFSVLPLKSNISGDGNISNSRFLASGLFLEQKFGPCWFEAAANRQDSGRIWLSSSDWASAVVRADPNALLPNGQPNSNVGKLYIDSNAAQQTFDTITDDFRATGAYTLDLREKNPWFGTYSATGLLSRRVSRAFSDNLFEVNTTPVGDAIYPRDVTNANNRLWRRVYLDPFGPGPKGGVDARHYQITQGGVTSGFRRVQNQGIRTRDELESYMYAGQAKLLKDRLVITGGVRHDQQKNFAGTATQDAVTREFSPQTLSPTSTDFEGETRTFGAVLHLTKWASAFYNQSNNFVPQSTLTINGSQLGPRNGKGRDYGVKLRLLDGRLYTSVTRYNTSEVNRQAFADGGLVNAINEIYEAIGDPTRVAGPTSRDGIDTEGKGYEFEVTANPTRQWRFTLNFAQTQGTQANNQPRNRAYVAERRAAWLTRAGLPLIAPIQGVTALDPKTGAASTVSTAIDTIDNFIKTILGANGVTRRQLREYTGSTFVTYTFKTDGQWLNGLTTGAGVRYRAKPVVGYLDGVTPIFGQGDTLVNLLLRKTVRIFNRQLQFQVNLDNVLNVNDPIVVDADVNGRYRFLYPTPFRWSVSATLNF